MIYALFKDIPLKISLPLCLAAILLVAGIGLRSCSAISFAFGTEKSHTSPDVHTSPARSYDDLRVPESPPGGPR